MEDDEVDNDFLVENFQEEVKDSQTLFKSESGNDEKSPDYNEINDDDVFQYSLNKNSPQKEILKYEKNRNIFQMNSNKKKNQNQNNNYNFNYSNDNYFLESPHKQSNNLNVNEDISGLSLLKELEDQWNIIEKQKMNYYNKSKEDESTNYNTKYNVNYEQLKNIKDMVECKKNKFMMERQKAKNIRNNDQEIEQFFLIKFKEMEKYKIFDNDLKKKIEIRQQEKLYEERLNQNQNNIENNENNNNEYNVNYNIKDIDDMNDNYYENELINQNRKKNVINSQYNQYNKYKKKSFSKNNGEERNNNQNQINQNNNNYNYNYNNTNPELDELIYETPARANYFNNEEIINNIKNNNKDYSNNDEITQNEDINLEKIKKIEKNNVSGKLVEKMKNLFNEIKGQNNQNNNNKFEQIINKNNNYLYKEKNRNNKAESGVFGINNINIINDNYRNNSILMNINNNTNMITDNNKINDANKSINLNFNYNNNYINNNNINNIKYENQNHSINQSDISINKENNNKYYHNDNSNDGLTCLQQNFDNIMKQIKSNNGKSKINNFYENENSRFINEENSENKELDKYFEELSREAKLKVKYNKGYEKPILQNKYQGNKIKMKIEENSEMLNKFMNEMNQNKNKFKQRMMALNYNINNIKKDRINDSYQLFGNNTNRYNRKKSGLNTPFN